jgi:hypothetical protein
VAYRLINDIKGYHFYFFIINSPNNKIYDDYTVSPVIVASGLPNLVILSNALFICPKGVHGGFVPNLVRVL